MTLPSNSDPKDSPQDESRDLKTLVSSALSHEAHRLSERVQMSTMVDVNDEASHETLFSVSLRAWGTQRTASATQSSISDGFKDAEVSSNDCFGLKPYPINLGQTLTSYQAASSDTPLAFSDDFTITGVIGEGGMGRVYSGVQTCLNREVALKVAKHDPTNVQIRAQVIHEAQVTSLLEHPNIMPVHLLAVERSGQIIQVLKRISGVSWHELLYDPHHPHWSELQVPEGQQSFHLDILAQVCSALSYAHELGVIHRDLKPENIMVGRFGEVYVLDWGVALVLDAIDESVEETAFKAQVAYGFANLLVGTLAYMSPEMARCDVQQYGGWCDVYLLGAIFHEILCGERIRADLPVREGLERVVSGELPPFPAHLPEEYAALLRDALSIDINQRPQDARAFRERLLNARQSARAHQILNEARSFTADLKEGISDQAPMPHLTALYDEARLSYRAHHSLDARSICSAQESDTLHSMWAQHLIELGELGVAEQVLLSRYETDDELEERLVEARSARTQQRDEHRALQEWSDQETLAKSRSLRVRLATLGLIFFGGGSLSLDLSERLGVVALTAYDEMIASVSLSIAASLAFLGIIRWRAAHAYEQNAVFNRIWQYLLLTLVFLSTQRFISWKLGLTPHQLIHLEMPLVSLSCFGLSSISQQRDFIFGGVAFLGTSFLSVYYPSLTTLFYAFAMIILWIGVLISWSSERREFQQSAHASRGSSK